MLLHFLVFYSIPEKFSLKLNSGAPVVLTDNDVTSAVSEGGEILLKTKQRFAYMFPTQ